MRSVSRWESSERNRVCEDKTSDADDDGRQKLEEEADLKRSWRVRSEHARVGKETTNFRKARRRARAWTHMVIPLDSRSSTRMSSLGLKHIAQIPAMYFTKPSQTQLVKACGLCFLQVCQLQRNRKLYWKFGVRQMSRRWSRLHGIQSRVGPVRPCSSERSIAEDQQRRAFRKCRTSCVTTGGSLQSGRIVVNRLRVGECSQATAVEPMMVDAS